MDGPRDAGTPPPARTLLLRTLEGSLDGCKLVQDHEAVSPSPPCVDRVEMTARCVESHDDVRVYRHSSSLADVLEMTEPFGPL